VVFALAAWLHYERTRSAIEQVLTIIVVVVGMALIAYLLVTAASV